METQASAVSGAHASEVSKLKEQQQQIQKEVMDDMHAKLTQNKQEIEKLRADREQLMAAKNEMELTLKLAEADRDALRSAGDRIKSQLEAQTQQDNESRESQVRVISERSTKPSLGWTFFFSFSFSRHIS